jgi:hypothetical protein
VAIGAQLLSALVFVDFRLPTFFQRSHTVKSVKGLSVPGFGLVASPESFSVNDFVQGILDDPFSAGGLKFRDDFPDHLLIEDRFDRHPAWLAQRRDGWITQGGQCLQHLWQLVGGNI